MTRRRSLLAQAEQARRAAERARRAELAKQASLLRQLERQQKAEIKGQQQRYLEARIQEVDGLNAQLRERITELTSILAVGLARNPALEFEALKDRSLYPALQIPNFLSSPLPVLREESYIPPPPTLFTRLFGQGSYRQKVEAGRRAYEDACSEHQKQEESRLEQIERLREEHERSYEAYAAEQRRQHQRIDKLAADYQAGAPEAVRSYFEAVLVASPYPEGFPEDFRLAYIPDSRQLVIDYCLPLLEVVPEEAEYRYVKARDEVTHTARKIGERRTLYAEILSALTLRTLYEIFTADTLGHVDVVAFSGYVNTIDAGTGKEISPYLISVRTTRASMEELDLGRIDPVACLRHLQAQVSRSPAELVPVRPIVDFNMVDPRFIEYGDVLSTLDQRPNLMEMSPSEFETLVTNLFAKMGLETKLTQASRDGGVDCVAYDQRPILDGKVVIQAKRYKHTVGVSAVRDLFGTMHNEGANKGILVTTSDYGKAAFDFAAGKPIELISGSNLLYLLQEQGIEAKIEMPVEWQDPAPAG
jgi:restriction system protein